ncbi:hypothetical protein cypCar_00035897 [Cyprinus carpio]|nr:hypothetical protein cypCar_00035897 [Cyprinus carpio]
MQIPQTKVLGKYLSVTVAQSMYHSKDQVLHAVPSLRKGAARVEEDAGRPVYATNPMTAEWTATKKKAEQKKKTGGGPAPPHYTPAEELALGLNVSRPIVEGIPGGTSSLDQNAGTSKSNTFITAFAHAATHYADPHNPLKYVI